MIGSLLDFFNRFTYALFIELALFAPCYLRIAAFVSSKLTGMVSLLIGTEKEHESEGHLEEV